MPINTLYHPDKNYYKIGCNFDPELIDICDQLNKKYEGKSKIIEFFGSDRAHQEISARPGFRIPDISKEDFEEFVKKSLSVGIKFNYVANSIIPYGSKTAMLEHKKEIQDFILWLEEIGVYRITVANPMMAAFIREVSNIELEISCITHVDTVTQFKYYHETFGINKFCCSILKNRNKKFLKNAADYCNKNGIIIELLAQEFCGVAGEDKEGTPYATHCAFRDSCYICHATNRTKEDAKAYHNYPMGYCMDARSKNEQNWLRMRWIRPEDQKRYREIGINYFKISGRTASTEYLKMVAEAYMSENFDGNLLTLWKPLQTIYNGQKELEFNHRENIPNKKLDHFLDKWFDGDGWECENEMCGTTCTYCKDYWDKYFKKDNE